MFRFQKSGQDSMCLVDPGKGMARRAKPLDEHELDEIEEGEDLLAADLAEICMDDGVVLVPAALVAERPPA